jgi:hypothetical protein
MALARDGTLWTWGSNQYGQLGIGHTTAAATPTRVYPLTNVVSIGAGYWHAVALDASGRLWGWGMSLNGELGTANVYVNHIAWTPQLVPLPAPTAFSGGMDHLVVATTTGSVQASGVGQWGQLGTGLDTPSLVLVSSSSLSLASNSWLAGDPDADGLATWREYLLGTDPLAADTNGNGIADGPEHGASASAVNPDSDGDTIPDATEVQRGTDPFRADTDGDTVNDAADAFPLDPTRWQAPTPDPNDVTPPTITLTEPTNAVPIP